MYRYLNIRSDKDYSEFLETHKVKKLLSGLKGFIEDDYQVYKSTKGNPWTIINLLEADKEGNYSLNKAEQKEKINLIEIICSETDEQWYNELAEIVAKQFSWEVKEV